MTLTAKLERFVVNSERPTVSAKQLLPPTSPLLHNPWMSLLTHQRVLPAITSDRSEPSEP